MEVLLDGCQAATALLAAGRRGPARSLIRILARSAATGALPGVFGSVLRALSREFAAWTGDGEFLEKYPVGAAASGMVDAGGCEATGGIIREEFALFSQVIRGVWGLEPAAFDERLTLVLRPPAGRNEMTLAGLRIGKTTLLLRYRCRPGQVLLRCEVTRGPALRIESTLGSATGVTGVTVDEVALGGGRAVFRASGNHEVVFELTADG